MAKPSLGSLFGIRKSSEGRNSNKGTQMSYLNISHHFPAFSGTQMPYSLLFHRKAGSGNEIANLSSFICKMALLAGDIAHFSSLIYFFSPVGLAAHWGMPHIGR